MTFEEWKKELTSKVDDVIEALKNVHICIQSVKEDMEGFSEDEFNLFLVIVMKRIERAASNE